jgi:cytochrome c oxidase subunit 1
MCEKLGKIHFIGTFIGMNGIFFPMFIQGLAGMNRRMADGGIAYQFNDHFQYLSKVMSYSAWAMAVFQLFFIYNFFVSLKKGKVAASNHWDATTIEWSDTTSPPHGHGNFAKAPVVYRGAYDYSMPGAAHDFTPQTQA